MDSQNTISTSQTPQPHPAKKPLLSLMIATLLVASGLVIGYLIGKSSYGKFDGVVVPSPTQAVVACTLDAKVCPDGSSVGRVGPNCEFAPCPTGVEQNVNEEDISLAVKNYLDLKKIVYASIGQPTEFTENTVYSVSYTPEGFTAGDPPYVLVGKVNGQWVVAEGYDSDYCRWIEESNVDESTKNFMGYTDHCK